MNGEVLKVTELNPRLGMEVSGLLREEGIDSHWLHGSELFVGFDSHGEVQGMACVRESGKECLIPLVVVKGSLRGKGRGSALINHILGYFSGRCDRVYVLAGEAQGFFHRFGFRGVSPDGVPEAITGLLNGRDVSDLGAGIMMLDLPRGWTM